MRRCLTYFLLQDYEGEHTQFIFNNSEVPTELDLTGWDLPVNKRVVLINSFFSYQTGMPYTNLGQIYADCMTHVTFGDVINFMDDDDQYLKNHIRQGVKGLTKAKTMGKIAYKSKFYFFKAEHQLFSCVNCYEPVFFIDIEHIRKYGFWDGPNYDEKTANHHHRWMDPMGEQQLLWEAEEGLPTFVQDWDTWEIVGYKTSCNAMSLDNFTECRKRANDHGILKPYTVEEMKQWNDFDFYQ
jgi:hypothetical protein